MKKLWMAHFLRVIILIFLLLGSGSAVMALTPGELLRQAQQAYDAGKYQQAIQAWRALTEIGFVNGDLYYNMGNAYWRLGQVGEARLHFLKAVKLLPRDPQVRENLEFISEKIQPLPPAMGPWALLAKVPFYRIALNLGESLWFAAGASLAFFTVLILFRLQRKKLWLVLGVFLLVPFGYGMFSLATNFWETRFDRRVVVLQPQVPLLSAPTADAKPETEIREGMVLQLLRNQGDFALVKTPEGKEAWVESKSIGEV